MFQIDAMSRTPVYEQIIDQMERFIANGLLAPGDQIPSVRGLSLSLKTNPNTIQKAYSELDARGIIRSVPGKGCFVCPDARNIIKEAKRSGLASLRSVIDELALAGIDREEILSLVNDVYQTHANSKKENTQ